VVEGKRRERGKERRREGGRRRRKEGRKEGKMKERRKGEREEGREEIVYEYVFIYCLCCFFVSLLWLGTYI
jgi:hypothetical protein